MTPQAIRQKIIDTIWSGAGLPTAGVNSVAANITPPLTSVPGNLLRADRASIVMTGNGGAVSKTIDVEFFYPTAATRNGRMAIHVFGHGTPAQFATDTSGHNQLVQQLIAAGYTVGMCYMPDDGSVPAHNSYPEATATLNYLKFFVEAPIRMINYLDPANYSRVCASGKSGGGFTIALLDAIDTRIHRAAAVAGSMPMMFVRGTDGNPDGTDFEQNLPSIQFVDFHDLYVLGCHPGRRHLQILNTGDPSIGSYKSVGQRGYSWHKQVAAKASEFGGIYRLQWDLLNAHDISAASRAAIINFYDEA